MNRILILALALCAGCGRGGDSGSSTGATKLGPEGERLLTSVELARAFVHDPDFDKNFRHKMVIVEGEITYDKGVDKDRPVLYLEGFQSVQIRCLRTEAMAGLRAGRKVKIRGRVNYENRNANLLTECDLVSK